MKVTTEFVLFYNSQSGTSIIGQQFKGSGYCMFPGKTKLGESTMNVFFHGTIEAGFDAIKAKIEKDMAGPMGQWISEYRLADLGNNEVMCAMNCTNMEAMGAFMADPAEMQWDKDNGAVYKAYMMSEMTE